MKSLPFLFLFLIVFSPLKAFSQVDEAESFLSEEESVVAEEIAAVRDNGDNMGEMERQEDMVHPEGEYEWSLGGEDLPAEEYE